MVAVVVGIVVVVVVDEAIGEWEGPEGEAEENKEGDEKRKMRLLGKVLGEYLKGEEPCFLPSHYLLLLPLLISHINPPPPPPVIQF